MNSHIIGPVSLETVHTMSNVSCYNTFTYLMTQHSSVTQLTESMVLHPYMQ